MKIADLYESVTNNIIRDLQNGAVPWVKPWKSRGGLMPVNAATGRHYHGINVPILWDSASRHGFSLHAWMTFKQALDKGACVRKGEKGTHIVFVRKLQVGEKDEEKTVSMMKVHYVFNIAQIEGLPGAEPIEEVPLEERHEYVEQFVRATKAQIEHGPYEAAYIPSRDFITMPARGVFKNNEHYFATLLHECGHWSGAKHRLDRDLEGRFGGKKYAAEELVAELTSAFLCAHLGVQGELRHAGYIEHWIELLKEDDRAIFTASSKASRAADYLRSFSEQIEQNCPP
jgi:antirestriction protein ArdC